MTITELHTIDLNAELAGFDEDNLAPIRKHVPPAPRSIGSSRRPKKVKEYFVRTYTRLKALNPEWDHKRLWDEAFLQTEDELKLPKGLAKQFNALAPTIPASYRGNVMELCAVAAIRRTEHVRLVEQHLKSRRETRGRKSNHALTTSVLEQNCFEGSIPEIKGAVQDFWLKVPLRDYAYEAPLAAQGPKWRGGVGEAMHAILNRNHPNIPMVMNIKAIAELASSHPKAEIGKYCALDGTDVEAYVQQHQTYSKAEDDLINRNEDPENPKNTSRFQKHETKTKGSGNVTKSKQWRGYTLLTITCLKSSLPLVSLLVSDDPSYAHIHQMMKLVYRYWPECPMEELSSDREFASADFIRNMYEYWSVIFVPPLKGDGDAEFRKKYDRGAPKCCPHAIGENHDGRMELIGREGWMIGNQRSKPPQNTRVPTARGVRVPYDRERLLWRCRNCLGTENTHPKKNPVMFHYLPHTGEHEGAMHRKALEARQNVAESFNALLRTYGVAGRGATKAKWIKTDAEMSWVLYLTILGMTLRRLTDLNGSYDRELKYAFENGLIHERALDELTAGRDVEIILPQQEADENERAA